MHWLIRVLLFFAACARAFGGSEPGLPLKYVGGTFTPCALNSNARLYLPGSGLILRCNAHEVKVGYDKITLVRYSQTLRLSWTDIAVPEHLLLQNRSHRHFVTIEYTAAEGAKQGLILLVAQGNVRGLLADLRARTGRPVEFEDRDPRK